MPASRILRRWALLLVALLSLAIAATALPYFRFQPSAYFEPQRLVYLSHRGALYAHITGAVLALITMPLQLSRRLRTRHPALHRIIGRLYVVGVAVGGVGGLALAPVAHGGAVAQVGFAALAVAWLSTTALGLAAIRGGHRSGHRRWMARSAALTFAAVTLRLYLGAVLATTGGQWTDTVTVAYGAIAWVCWVPNLALAWWWTSNRGGRVAPKVARVSTKEPGCTSHTDPVRSR